MSKPMGSLSKRLDGLKVGKSTIVRDRPAPTLRSFCWHSQNRTDHILTTEKINEKGHIRVTRTK